MCLVVGQCINIISFHVMYSALNYDVYTLKNIVNDINKKSSNDVNGEKTMFNETLHLEYLLKHPPHASMLHIFV